MKTQTIFKEVFSPMLTEVGFVRVGSEFFLYDPEAMLVTKLFANIRGKTDLRICMNIACYADGITLSQSGRKLILDRMSIDILQWAKQLGHSGNQYAWQNIRVREDGFLETLDGEMIGKESRMYRIPEFSDNALRINMEAQREVFRKYLLNEILRIRTVRDLDLFRERVFGKGIFGPNVITGFYLMRCGEIDKEAFMERASSWFEYNRNLWVEYAESRRHTMAYLKEKNHLNTKNGKRIQELQEQNEKYYEDNYLKVKKVYDQLVIEDYHDIARILEDMIKKSRDACAVFFGY